MRMGEGSLNTSRYPAYSFGNFFFCLFTHYLHLNQEMSPFTKYLNYYSLYSHIKQYTYVGTLFNAMYWAGRI